MTDNQKTTQFTLKNRDSLVETLKSSLSIDNLNYKRAANAGSEAEMGHKTRNEQGISETVLAFIVKKDKEKTALKDLCKANERVRRNLETQLSGREGENSWLRASC